MPHYQQLTNLRRRLLVANNQPLRIALKYLSHARGAVPDKVRFLAQFKLAALAPATAASRLSAMCVLTGRGRGIVPDVHLSRIMFRELALDGQLHGVIKSSW